MRARLIELVKTYLLFLGIFALQKPLFMLCYRTLYAGVSCADWGRVIWHGLVLDTSVAAYFTVIPGLLAVISAWSRTGILHGIYKGYYLLVSLLLAFIFVVDVALYDYWGFRLDATPLFYFRSSPQDAMASVSGWYIALGLVAAVAYAALLYGLFHAVLLRRRVWNVPATRSPLLVSFVLLVLTGALFIPIRGGFTVASMNTGHVYFST
ncbi:MAG: LTA synthase family protein, partial [Bacteroidales bacterium]|nr:LTA synthase family protein [Bacteroidales bacterium]